MRSDKNFQAKYMLHQDKNLGGVDWKYDFKEKKE